MAEKINAAKLEELKRMEAAAIEGPWEYDAKNAQIVGESGWVMDVSLNDDDYDLALIIAMRNNLADLISDLEAARADADKKANVNSILLHQVETSWDEGASAGRAKGWKDAAEHAHAQGFISAGQLDQMLKGAPSGGGLFG